MMSRRDIWLEISIRWTLNFPAIALRRFGDFGMLDHRHIGGVLGDKRKHRHQVRLTGPVVADDQDAHVVHRLVERQLGDHQLRDPRGHVVGNDVGRNQLLRFIRVVGVQKLNDRFNRLELNEIACSASTSRLPPSTNFERDQAIDAVVLMFWMSCYGIGKSAFPKLPRPHGNDATRMGMSFKQLKRIELQ